MEDGREAAFLPVLGLELQVGQALQHRRKPQRRQRHSSAALFPLLRLFCPSDQVSPPGSRRDLLLQHVWSVVAWRRSLVLGRPLAGPMGAGPVGAGPPAIG